MRSAIIENGVVVNVIIGEVPGSIPCGEAGIGWSYDGETFSAPPPPEPEPPTLADYEDAIQRLVDATARTKSYRDGVTFSSYANSTNPQWSADAHAFIAWRDAVWGYSYSELAKVQNGERERPSVQDFLEELPVIVWP